MPDLKDQVIAKLIEERDALKAESKFLREDNTLLQAENVNLKSIVGLHEKAAQVFEAGREALAEKAAHPASNRFSTFADKAAAKADSSEQANTDTSSAAPTA